MTEIFFQKDYIVDIEEDYEPTDSWDRPNTFTSWTFGKVCLLEPVLNHSNWDSYEKFNVPFDVNVGDRIYLVVPVWSSGDSFHYEYSGYSEIFGVFKTQEEAKEYRLALMDDKEITIGKYKLYKPWEGYFESLDEIHILERVVLHE